MYAYLPSGEITTDFGLFIFSVRRTTLSNPVNSRESISCEGDSLFNESDFLSESALNSESLFKGIVALTSKSLSVQEEKRKIRNIISELIIKV